MPRYLTPAKLCLLILIDLYISDQIPADSRSDALSFIASHINTQSVNDRLQIQERLQTSTSDITVFAQTLSRWQSGVPGRTIYDILLHKVWCLNDLDSLHALFHEVDDLVAPATPESPEAAAAKISRASSLGQFIRRCCVEFTRPQFSDSQALWGSFSAYRASSFDHWASRNPDAARNLEAEQPAWAAASSSQYEADVATYSSADDTEHILSASIHHLQKLGTRVPAGLKSQLSHWLHDLQDSSAQSLQHFLAFFEHWRAAQYTMALESLHRYFDYSLVGKGAGEVGKESGMKMYYQYALLHLSVLHADFERWGESGDAMAECIATARENQDPACLNFALSYLIHLRQVHPQTTTGSFSSISKLIGGGSGSDQDEISFLKAKAREGRHWGLLSSTLLEEARGEMEGGGNLSKAMECILQSEYLDVQHDLRTMMPAGKLFLGAGYERLGQASLSNRIYDSIDLIHESHCPLADGVRAHCRMAHALARSGQYDEALMRLSAAKEGRAKGVLKLEQRLLTFEMLIILRKSVHAEDFNAAGHHLEQLRPARAFGDVEVTFEIILLEVELLLKKREYTTALHIVNTKIKELKANPKSDIAQVLHLFTMKARIFAEAREPVKGLSIALRAAATAERLLIMPVLVEAIAALTGVLMALGEFAAAKGLVEGGIVHALEGRNTFVVARLFSQLAEATIGVAGHECEHGSGEQKKCMRAAEGYLERGYEAYMRIFDLSGMLHCLSIKAHLARWNKDEATATQADEKYMQLMADKMAGQRLGE